MLSMNTGGKVKMYKENKIVQATDLRKYYLSRANLITGSLTTFPNVVKVLENGKIVNKEIQYNQTLTKQIDELIQNAIDENVRTKGDYANKIVIKIDQESGYITVSDNGRGLPIDTYVLASTKFMTSSNFEFMDGAGDTSDTVGMNGIGSKLVGVRHEGFGSADGVIRIHKRADVAKVSPRRKEFFITICLLEGFDDRGRSSEDRIHDQFFLAAFG